MRCVFFGSPDFAAASLEALLASPHEVVGIITQPDRPSGRGLKLEAPAVKKLALARHLPIFQPEKLNSEETYAWLREKKPEILVVVAYGEFLGKILLEFCQIPPINVHPSLLPDLRGAAPMQWSLLRGYRKSGVTTQFMRKEMDAGDILLQTPVDIDPNENGKELQERMKKIGGDLLVQTLTQLEGGKIIPRPQDHSKATLAPLLKKEDGDIPWSKKSAWEIHNQIRGLYPWPAAYTFCQEKRVKILRSHYKERKENIATAAAQPGRFVLEDKRLWVRCADTTLEILELQPEGKRAQLPAEFMSGMKNSKESKQNFFFHSATETI